MSLIPELGKGMSNLPAIIERYEADLQHAEATLSLEGKRLEAANKEQPAWQSYYDQRRIELYTLVKFIDAEVNRIRGTLFRSYTENYSRELTDRAKDKYIDHEQAYLDILELYLEVKELYDKYDSLVDAFRTRGFALNNITKIRVAAMEDVIL